MVQWKFEGGKIRKGVEIYQPAWKKGSVVEEVRKIKSPNRRVYYSIKVSGNDGLYILNAKKQEIAYSSSLEQYEFICSNAKKDYIHLYNAYEEHKIINCADTADVCYFCGKATIKIYEPCDKEKRTSFFLIQFEEKMKVYYRRGNFFTGESIEVEQRDEGKVIVFKVKHKYEEDEEYIF